MEYGVCEMKCEKCGYEWVAVIEQPRFLDELECSNCNHWTGYVFIEGEVIE